MKTFTIIYIQTSREAFVVVAKSQKDAEKKFRERHRDNLIVDVHVQDKAMSLDGLSPTEIIQEESL